LQELAQTQHKLEQTALSLRDMKAQFHSVVKERNALKGEKNVISQQLKVLECLLIRVGPTMGVPDRPVK